MFNEYDYSIRLIFHRNNWKYDDDDAVATAAKKTLENSTNAMKHRKEISEQMV